MPSQALSDAIAAHRDAGMLFVAAAGNSGSSMATMSARPSARIDRPSTTFLSLRILSGSVV